MNAEGLLNELFSEECRPSLRWLRTQTKARTIPHFRIGHLVFFEVEMVRAYLAESGWSVAVVGRSRADAAGLRRAGAAYRLSVAAGDFFGQTLRILGGRSLALAGCLPPGGVGSNSATRF